MGIEEDFKRLLEDAIIKCGSARKLAELGKTSEANISRWRKGVSPHLKDIAAMFDSLGVSVHLDQADLALIPKLAARAGAGSSFVTQPDKEGLYAFRRSFLRRVGISEANSVLLDVMGPSMQPTLEDGDTILVDMSKTILQDSKIFLVGLEEELLVKQVIKVAKGWVLRSKNPEFMDIPVTEADNFTVVGKVVWVGRNLS